MTVITISRQYGSGGDVLAGRVCELLGYRYFDKKLMTEVASRAGLSEGEVLDLSEVNFKSQSVLSRLVSLLSTPAAQTPVTVAQASSWQRDTTGAQLKQVEPLTEQQAVSLMEQTLRAAYQVGNVVIVGRGGQAVLRDMPGVLHVRVEAPLAVRIPRVAETNRVSSSEAERLIGEHDKASAGYVKRFYKIDWSDPLLYHLTINVGVWKIESAARLITDAAKHLLE